MRIIKDIDVKGKTVLVRVDYNVPLKDGEISDDLRIRASLPTLEYLRDHGASRIILVSHLGRPKGKEVPEFSLAPVAKRLSELLGEPVGFYALPREGEKIPILRDEKFVLLENLRFDNREEGNSPEFVQNIIGATGAELFVQDGFAVVHRAHASTVAVAQFLPVYAGLLLEKEITNLTQAISDPARPLLLILGGAKVEDKAPLVKRFSGLADYIAVGGKIAADGFLASSEYSSGDIFSKKTEGNLAEKTVDKSAGNMAEMTEKVERSVGEPKNLAEIYVAEDFDEDATGAKLDIGPVATGKIANLITDAGTIIWNGLLGKAEDPAFATASTIVAELMGEKSTAKTIVCGGDTTGFVEQLTREHPSLEYSLVSTGGGAALEFLLGRTLPGIAVIK